MRLDTKRDCIFDKNVYLIAHAADEAASRFISICNYIASEGYFL
jgi:hypothetical protein